MPLFWRQRTHLRSFFAQKPAATAVRAIKAIVPVTSCRPGRSRLGPTLIGGGFGKARAPGQTDTWRNDYENGGYQQYPWPHHGSPIDALIPIHEFMYRFRLL